MTPKYLTCWHILISLSPSLSEVFISHFFFQVNKIASVLVGLKLRPVFSPHSLILSKHCCPMFIMVSISIPLMSRFTSSAKPSESAGVLLIRIMRELITRFHSMGDRIPPCGHPFLTFFDTDLPWTVTVTVRLLNMALIHLTITCGSCNLARASVMVLKETLSKAPSMSKKIPRAY
ncbi:unnamed protein product [Meganyctiphanes norvegica]|uniref:Uncharacterized protein n=1 Tax=Meganyctiphanes norvegica TaxID=48144 RepID=A0AAV2QWI5_MEGNR